jgi:predicted PurR-regulated permease PerM
LIKTVADTRKKLKLEMPPLAAELKAVEIRLENMTQLEQLEDISYLGAGQLANTEVYNDDLQKKLSDELNASDTVAQAWENYITSFKQLQELQQQIANPVEPDGADDELLESISPAVRFFDFQQQLQETIDQFSEFKVQLLGGSRFRIWLTELANPTPEVLEQYGSSAIEYIRNLLLNIGTSTTSFVGRLLLGVVIMIISVYFFLLDGPRMLDSLKRLSPIDDQYEQELYDEFGRVSRAVVVATLLAALVQGLLGGIGYYFAGLQSVFLLTLLTGVLALVPFVGAAAVWISCSLWLYFVDNNLTAAIGLAVYGTLVISMSDNLIKPLVLHGQSNLHPLLALLSVLGGVAALGPIGILIGPMIVAFLQTLLKILQREMTQFDAQSKAAAAG